MFDQLISAEDGKLCLLEALQVVLALELCDGHQQELASRCRSNASVIDLLVGIGTAMKIKFFSVICLHNMNMVT